MDIRDLFQTSLLIIGILFIPLVSSVLFLIKLVRENSLIEIVYHLLENCMRIVTAIPQTAARMWNLKSTDSFVAAAVKLTMLLVAFPFVLTFFLFNDELI